MHPERLDIRNASEQTSRPGWCQGWTLAIMVALIAKTILLVILVVVIASAALWTVLRVNWFASRAGWLCCTDPIDQTESSGTTSCQTTSFPPISLQRCRLKTSPMLCCTTAGLQSSEPQILMPPSGSHLQPSSLNFLWACSLTCLPLSGLANNMTTAPRQTSDKKCWCNQPSSDWLSP